MKDLGISTAYGYAVSSGYTGTEEEFAELMASYAHVAEDARASAETASNAKDDAVSAKNTAVTSAQTASAKASEAAQSAQNASTSASTASTKASEASASASNAQTSASTASTKASEAASSATSANSAKTDAVNAKNAAQTAQTASETARTAAEEAQASAERAAEEAHDVIDHKADIDGYYEEMTVGDAEQLVSSQFVTDSVPYLYRTTGGSADVGNREYMESIVGGTVAWNQLIVEQGQTSNGITTTFNSTEKRFDVSGTATSGYSFSTESHRGSIITGHKYAIIGDYSLNDNAEVAYRYIGSSGSSSPIRTFNNTISLASLENASYIKFRLKNLAAGTEYLGWYKAQVFDLTQMFGSTIADYIYSLEQANEGAGVAWFKKLFPLDYYPYDAGTLKHVEGLTSHDTVGFNQFNAETITRGQALNTSGATVPNTSYNVSDYIKVLPNTNYYFKNIASSRYAVSGAYYDENKSFISTFGIYGGADVFGVSDMNTTPSNAQYVRINVHNSFVQTCCVNLSWSGWRNGEYEPYQKHSYPLDSTLVLRGIPKLDAQNNLYYNGDVYEADGTVERKYGIVDLGTLNWNYSAASTPKHFSTPLVTAKTQGANMRCPVYQYIATTWSNFTASSDKTMYVDTNRSIYIHDESYTSAADFKAAMSGVMLVYELATPTTEEAEPFQEVQICDDFGTEEFKSSSIVPVGHNTEYPANLRDKLQHLPNIADADGYYMIKQVNKQMSLEHFRIPKAPTEDGTWVLKAVVSGGTPTYSWVKEETA